LKLNAQALCLLTQSLSPSVEASMLKKHGYPIDAHLLWRYIKEKFSESRAVQDSKGADYLTKPVGLIGQTGHTGMANLADSRLQQKKRHQSNQNSTSQTSTMRT
jgi:hypothetical protein